jgi:hypothetical protein
VRASCRVMIATVAHSTARRPDQGSLPSPTSHGFSRSPRTLPRRSTIDDQGLKIESNTPSRITHRRQRSTRHSSELNETRECRRDSDPVDIEQRSDQTNRRCLVTAAGSPLTVQVHPIGVEHDVLTGRCSSSFLWLTKQAAGATKHWPWRSRGDRAPTDGGWMGHKHPAQPDP